MKTLPAFTLTLVVLAAAAANAQTCTPQLGPGTCACNGTPGGIDNTTYGCLDASGGCVAARTIICDGQSSISGRTICSGQCDFYESDGSKCQSPSSPTCNGVGRQPPAPGYPTCRPSQGHICPVKRTADGVFQDLMRATSFTASSGATYTCTPSLVRPGLPMGGSDVCPDVGPIASSPSFPAPFKIVGFNYTDGYNSPITFDGQNATFRCGGWWDDAAHPFSMTISTTPGFPDSSYESLAPGPDSYPFFGSDAHYLYIGSTPQAWLNLVADCSQLSASGGMAVVPYVLSGDNNVIPTVINLILVR